MSSTNELSKHQKDFIDAAMTAGALKFGSFVLKSGRSSPYFFNAGFLSSGPLVASVASAYAELIAKLGIDFDVVFGPAYKGIPFAATTALTLYRDYGISVGYAYDRKEVKDHGEGGRMVGAEVKGKRVLILDDVMTAGTAVRSSIDIIQKEGGQIVGIVMLLDREEVTVTGRSTVKDVQELLGGVEVKSIIRMRDLIVWLEKNGQKEHIDSMKAYWTQYGVKE